MLPEPTRVGGSSTARSYDLSDVSGWSGSAGLPSAVMVQGRPLSDFVDAASLDLSTAVGSASTGAPVPADGMARQPSGPFAGAGGQVTPGLRQPSGPVLNSSRYGREPDFRAQATKFYKAWGTPPNNDYFAWDPTHDYYKPRMAPEQYRATGALRKYYEAVYAHHNALATRGIHLQAYRAGGELGTGPWRFRWIRAEPGLGLHEQEYKVLGDGYDAFGYSGTTVQGFQQQEQEALAAARERDEDAAASIAGTDFGSAGAQ